MGTTRLGVASGAAWVKRWFGYTCFLLKGLENVRAEWTLMTLAYNRKRVLNLVSFPELMAAVQPSAAQPV